MVKQCVQCAPFIRENNWMTRNLVIAGGNFNMVNNRDLFPAGALGQHP